METSRIEAKPELIRLNQAEVQCSWKVVLPMLQRALEYCDGEITAEDLFTFIMQGMMDLWVAYEEEKIWAVAVTEIAQYPRMRMLRIVALSGEDIQVWKHFDAYLERYAFLQGCKMLEGLTRLGMEKVAKEFGWRRRFVVLRKQVATVTH
jgi:hypothetical protein